MRILFITRKYPPRVGGMEKYSYELIKHLDVEKIVIALKKSTPHLVWFLLYALGKGIFAARRVDLVFLGDSLLAPLGWLIKKIAGKPVVVVAHGLDITYHNWLYQLLNVRALRYLDKVIAVSQATRELCLRAGVLPQKCVFIPNGVATGKTGQQFYPSDLARYLKFPVEQKSILLTVGRLTKRKGVAWFIQAVLPNLDPAVIYLVVGAGPEKQKIWKLIQRQHLTKRVFLLGQISDRDLELVYQTADVFVMPNISVPDDHEGFGLVALEAASRGLPVVAARLEGITDAIRDQHNGFLVAAGDAAAYVAIIARLLNNRFGREKFGAAAQKYTRENYHWCSIAARYLAEFKKISND